MFAVDCEGLEWPYEVYRGMRAPMTLNRNITPSKLLLENHSRNPGITMAPWYNDSFEYRWYTFEFHFLFL